MKEMEDRIEKSYKDLNWEEVDFNKKNNGSTCWTWNSGGYPLRDEEWSINFLEDKDHNLIETRYKLPQCINDMLNLVRKWGKDEVKSDIRDILRNILGCDECEKEDNNAY